MNKSKAGKGSGFAVDFALQPLSLLVNTQLIRFKSHCHHNVCVCVGGGGGGGASDSVTEQYPAISVQIKNDMLLLQISF